MTTLVHITHETREKMGGIGSVLEGLLATRAYQGIVDRTLLVGNAALPLDARPEDLEAILYASGGGPSEEGCLEPDLLAAFRDIERAWGVRLLYGRRRLAGPIGTRRTNVDVVLLDVRDARPEPVNALKGELYDAFGLMSDRFEGDWGYEEWVRLAGPALEATEALLGDSGGETLLVSHEFMGVPAVLAARIRRPKLRTIYYAHEVPPVRDLLEEDTGHRLVFDEAIRTRPGRRRYEARLRNRSGFKQALVSLAHRAHAVFAVSDRVAAELALLDPGFRASRVEVVYNGLPARPISIEERLGSRTLVRDYAEALVGFRPDYVFTHVTRPVVSKALERDLVVLEHLDDRLADAGAAAVLLVLASDGGRREPDAVRRMEAAYGWPVTHREGWPDLVGGEVPFGRAAADYNDYARATRAILVNQFGFDDKACGARVPGGMTFQDLRQGSDVEFGLSAYEPFGIAPLETLAFGGVCVLSEACGSARLVEHASGGDVPENVLFGRFSAGPDADADRLDPGDARRIEHEVGARLADALADRLPDAREDFARLLESGWALAEKMSWGAVAKAHFVPALARCLDRPVRRPAGAAS